MTTSKPHGAMPELLSARVRPNIEAAPWVVDAIKALEAKYRVAIEQAAHHFPDAGKMVPPAVRVQKTYPPHPGSFSVEAVYNSESDVEVVYRLLGGDSDHLAACGRDGVTQWQPLATAPKSTARGDDVHGIYILGYCPDPDTCNLESSICVVWFEPLMKSGKGMWYGEGGYEVHPTHWMPLPAAPTGEGA